jgi:hypothetical protein
MTQQTPSLIDHFTDGYRVVHRQPVLIALPILINLYLWFGTQISFGPLVEDLRRLMSISSADAPSETGAAETLTMLSQLDMRQPLAVLNSVPTLPVAQIIGLVGGATNVIEISSPWIAILIFMLINAVALPLSAIFLTRMADLVLGEKLSLQHFARRILRVGLSILGVAAIFGGVGAALLLPFVVFSAILFALNQAIGAFALTLVLLAVFWIQIYLGFSIEAIVVGGLNPLRAIHASFNIVRRNFWRTLGLLGISYIISQGCAVIWRALVDYEIGLFVAIIGSAYIGCGLQAARMIFFQDRLQQWQKLQQRTS